MAKTMIAYVCPGRDKQDRNWVLGAVAGDETGTYAVQNPELNVAEAAAGTDLSPGVLSNWAESMQGYIDHAGKTVYDQAQKKYVLVPPGDPRFLQLLADDAIKEWNYFYSPIEERPGSAREAAQQAATGHAGVK